MVEKKIRVCYFVNNGVLKTKYYSNDQLQCHELSFNELEYLDSFDVYDRIENDDDHSYIGLRYKKSIFDEVVDNNCGLFKFDDFIKSKSKAAYFSDALRIGWKTQKAKIEIGHFNRILNEDEIIELIRTGDPKFEQLKKVLYFEYLAKKWLLIGGVLALIIYSAIK